MPHAYSISPILVLCLFAGMFSIKENAKRNNPFPCSACDYVVLGYHNNGKKLNIKPGQILCLDATKHYEKIVFSNLKGTELEPIIIRNCGGKAVISSPGGFAVKFEASENFKFLGDGDSE